MEHPSAPESTLTPALDRAQETRHGDMPVDAFRDAAHAVVELMADYLARVEDFPVLPPIRPGDVARRLPSSPPEDPESIEAILADFQSIVEPNITHWQHPGFLAWFPSTASGPGILGEMLMATLVANAMLWRSSPAASELEQVTVGWLREAFGLPTDYDGLFTDTASTSSLVALAAARQTVMDAAQTGLGDQPRLRVYASAEAHSSIDKAAMTLGLGRDGVRHIETDDDYRMRPDALRAAIAEDRGNGWRPCAIVVTLGTTSSTSVDPADAIADIAERERLWLHVDAAYAGAAAIIPEQRHKFRGWERADSIVVNPHKWLFTPIDCSLLLSRRMETLQDAFSLVPEYLRTTGGLETGRNYNEYQPQLGRRFRALKVWMQLRYFGIAGLRARVAEHIAWAEELADWIDREPNAERLAPAPFSTVCLRWRPAELTGHESEPEVAERLDRLNEDLLARLNETGEIFVSHTRLHGRYAIRVAIGSLHTEHRHVERAWALIRRLGPEVAQTH